MLPLLSPLLCLISPVKANLIAAAILPHGDLALDPTFLEPGSSARDAADEVAAGSRQAAKRFISS